jgi:hypothetical protein
VGIESLLLTRGLNGYNRLGLLLLPVCHYKGRCEINVLLHVDPISAPVLSHTCFLISCIFSDISEEIFGKSAAVAASLT